ncbi:MAG: helix-turn-helix domain-containing protein [Pegethrix bostrychoides GSE-TBD4-15B]|jgi:transposase|uniref:Helix-turn-helix domain-containing protein n=1 Tax=Pegethrix bostrychoides GSE-TBD4-15B TaxID=2839662 RepID=A0A951U2X7_9CYAN|nr:helix-turn-helix domain-containing protein [Pegethrix bostrychoides GSE-TBD4-15B]
MVKKYIVTLNEEELQLLERFTTTGRHAAYQINHARILLKADQNQTGGSWSDSDIQEALDISVRTIERVRQRFVEEGLQAALKQRPGAGRKRQIQGEQEAHLIALRCSEPPKGKGRWTLRLLADQMVELGHLESTSHETVRQTLKKTNYSRGSKSVG